MPRKRSIASPLAVGRSMADKAMERRRAAARSRKRALARSKSLVVRKIVVLSKSDAEERTVMSVSAGVLIAEGDSWFDYPWGDVLSKLEDDYGYDVESVARRGDTVENMAYAPGQFDAFSRRVERVLQSGVSPTAILLSGGGNDIAGDEFGMLLNHALSGRAGLNESIVAGVVDQRVHDAYVTILSAITAICRRLIGRPVPILVHGYDYAVADGRGFLGGWGPLPGPWLEPGFERKGYPSLAVRKPIVVKLIDRFNAMLQRLTGRPPFSHVRYVDLRGTLSHQNYKDWWADELHPTQKGFEKVTAKFAAAL